jgi:TerC family integral membrane protein
VRIPRIYPELSGRRILSQELIEAPNVGQFIAGGTSADAVDPIALADRLIAVFLQQIFTIGTFHADPHPGNILVEPDGTIVLIDLGAVGRLGAGHREAVLDMLAAASAGNAAGLRLALGQITLFDRRIDQRQLEMALESFLARHLRSGGGIDAAAFEDLTILIGQYGIRLPRWFGTLSRTLVTLEGTLKGLDPSFSLVDAAKRHAKALLPDLTDVDPQVVLQRELIAELPRLRRLPERVDELLSQAVTGRLSAQFSVLSDERDERLVTRLVDRFVLGMIAAATSIASVLLLGVDAGPEVGEVGVNTVFGYFGLAPAPCSRSASSPASSATGRRDSAVGSPGIFEWRPVDRSPVLPPVRGRRRHHEGRLRQLRRPDLGVGRAHRRDRRDARVRPAGGAQDRPRDLDQGGGDRVRDLDLDRPGVRRHHAPVAGRPGRRGVLRRLPDREEPERRQRLRVGGDLLVLRRPREYQFRVLFWGIFGALVLRAAFIFAGVSLIEKFEWVLYSLRRLPALHGGQDRPPRRVQAGRLQQEHRHARRAQAGPDDRRVRRPEAVHRQNAKRVATPLFTVLVLIEATDVVFAVDSVPAILAVSRETFIVFASNAFAILGLRSLYFLLGGMQGKFRYLNIGLGVILAFVGVKMLLIGDPFEIHMPTYVSLSVIFLVLVVSIVASLQADKRDRQRGIPTPQH